jgi:hypothetical protein
MALKVTKDSAGGSKYGTGVFINKVTIAGVENLSGKCPDFLRSAPDVWLKLTLDVGRSFQPTMDFFGEFKRDDQTREIIDWGSAFKVKNLLANLGIEGNLGEDGSLPKAMIEQLVGKEFYRLQYVSKLKENGKLQYSDWTDAVETENPERLAKAFLKSVERGYPRNYSPDLVDSGSDDAISFNTEELESAPASSYSDEEL